jgi:hypothetical protein
MRSPPSAQIIEARQAIRSQHNGLAVDRELPALIYSAAAAIVGSRAVQSRRCRCKAGPWDRPGTRSAGTRHV